jgi:hypothetical protein
MSNGERKILLETGSLSAGLNAAQGGTVAIAMIQQMALVTVGSDRAAAGLGRLRFAAGAAAMKPARAAYFLLVRCTSGLVLLLAWWPLRLKVSAWVVGISLIESSKLPNCHSRRRRVLLVTVERFPCLSCGRWQV